MKTRKAVFSWGVVEADTPRELRIFLNLYALRHSQAYSKLQDSNSNAPEKGAQEQGQMAEWTGLEPATPGVTGPTMK
jgi:hypothetical protein